jgi:hypothetical protein
LKLGDFRTSETEHFAGVGNAPDAYRDAALGICESLGKVYQQVFRDKGFAVELPDRRMTVVTLKDRETYGKFLGEAVGAEVGGHYDVDANRLVIFDFRADGPDRAANAERVNTFTLVHETMHQLTFNTGLLDRRADVPVAVSEGLAMYGELWQHTNRRATLGIINKGRLHVFLDQAEARLTWFPVEELLANDGLFEGDDEQVAYAESWLLVHYLMKTSTRLPRFRDYLKALAGQGERARRLEVARASLGDLGALDRELKRHLTRCLRG